MSWQSAPLALALKAVDVGARASARVRPVRPRLPEASTDPGLAILIPECGTPDLLERCLASTRDAVAA
ncbi:MAG: hypothetical protein ABI580_05505, partial [Burkholderiaceae bacterium]